MSRRVHRAGGRVSKVKTFFTPGAPVWIYTDGNGRERGTVDARQAGVYRVKFLSDGHTELRKSADVSLRVPNHG